MIENVDDIRKLAATNTFALSLVKQFDSRGTLSTAQWEWVEKLQQPTPESVTLNAGSIYRMFESTADRLRYPRVRVSVGEQPLALSRAGDRAKYPGSINVTDGERYGENIWYGRIKDSQWEPSRNCEPWVTEWLIKFAADPVTVAADYGKLTGFCCFCNRPLTDDRSIAVGYGPVCATSWELPWGEKA